MARLHSKATVIDIGGNDISQYCSSSELGKATDTHDTTAYGEDSKSYTPGLNDSTFSVEGWYDTTASTGPRAVLNAVYATNAASAILRQLEGAGTGLPQDSFNAIMTAFNETSPVGDVVTWSAEFQVSGDVDITAQA